MSFFTFFGMNGFLECLSDYYNSLIYGVSLTVSSVLTQTHTYTYIFLCVKGVCVYIGLSILCIRKMERCVLIIFIFNT